MIYALLTRIRNFRIKLPCLWKHDYRKVATDSYECRKCGHFDTYMEH